MAVTPIWGAFGRRERHLIMEKNLTREEARTRAALLRVESYAIELDLREATGFTSTTTVRFTCAEPGVSSFAELDADLLDAALNGRAVGPLDGNRLVLNDLPADNVLTVHARSTYSRTGEGLHRFVDPADGLVYLWGQSFLDDAQRMFACFDQPDLKASIRLRVRAPEGWTVISLTRGELDDGAWRFAPTERISTYLFAVAAGPWHSVHRTWDDRVTFGLHCRRSLAPHLDADELFDVTGRSMTVQERLFGRSYPFGDTYDQLFLPEFNGGAMENPGAVTYDEHYVFRARVTAAQRRERAITMAHEMAHMWFGDLVTMRWWDDLWLNEAFAELLGNLTVDRATDFDGMWADYAAVEKQHAYRADQLPSTHPVRGDVVDNGSALANFDAISYIKGASVLRQLMATVGDAAFFTGLRTYIARHALGNTSFADLLAALEQASGRSLGEWAHAWLATTGVSTLQVENGALRQVSEVTRPHRLTVGCYDRRPGGLELRERVDVELGDAASLPPAELVLPNDTDLTYARIRLDPRSLSTALAGVGQLPDPLARAVVWSSLWDSCRDGELPVASYVDAVLAGVDAETDPSVVTALLTRAGEAATLYTHDGRALRARLAGAPWSAESGSDLELARVRAWAQLSADVPALHRRLDATTDVELRWELVDALAALGGLDDAAIDAHLRRDGTAAGRRHALRARAGLPDAAAKQRAWQAATTDTSLSNHETTAWAAGFWRAGQDELLTPYAWRYAEQIAGVFAARSPEVGRRLASELFQRTVVARSTLDVTAGLVDTSVPGVLRRIVVERRDDLARALRVRSTHAE